MAPLTQKDSELKQKWHKALLEQTIVERVNEIDSTADNCLKCFNTFLRNWLFIKNFDFFKHHPVPTVLQEIEKYIANAEVIIDNNGRFLQINWSDFVLEELHQLELFLNSKEETQERKDKAKRYQDFLKENLRRYQRIDSLFYLITNEQRYDSLVDFFSGKVKKGFVDTKKLNDDQEKLFYNVDRMYLVNLIAHDEKYSISKYESQAGLLFDYEGYKDPILLQEFPTEKRNYQKLLKAWFKSQLEIRKKYFEWDEIPQVYVPLDNYADSLALQQPVGSRYKKEVAPQLELQYTEEYPRHIFNTHKSYQLFVYLMKYTKTNAAISFVYRMMAQQDTPKGIIAKDIPFREWFNSQNFETKLDTYTKTFRQVKNEDRLAAYLIAKDMIYSE